MEDKAILWAETNGAGYPTSIWYKVHFNFKTNEFWLEEIKEECQSPRTLLKTRTLKTEE